MPQFEAFEHGIVIIIEGGYSSEWKEHDSDRIASGGG